MDEIFDIAKGELLGQYPDQEALIMAIPIIHGGAEDGNGSGYTIDNDWYHSHRDLSGSFWDAVKRLCRERGIQYRFVGIACGTRRGRTLYFRGFVFAE